MIFKYETEEERFLRFTKISPKKKLEWLHRMLEFTEKFSSRRQKEILQRLRESR